MDRKLVAQTWVFRGLCDLYFGFDTEDERFSDNALFSEIMGLEKFLKAILLFNCHDEYEELPPEESAKKLNELAKRYGHNIKLMMRLATKAGLGDLNRIKETDFDGYAGRDLVRAVTAGYMETRYPVPRPISDTFPIKGTELTWDPLSSSGISKFIRGVCKACFLYLSASVDFSSVLAQFDARYSGKESLPRFKNLLWNTQ